MLLKHMLDVVVLLLVGSGVEPRARSCLRRFPDIIYVCAHTQTAERPKVSKFQFQLSRFKIRSDSLLLLHQFFTRAS